VTASEVDAVLEGKKMFQESYKDIFKMEKLVLRNYMKIHSEDYGFVMSFSTVGGEKGFIVDKDGIHKRDDAQQGGADQPATASESKPEGDKNTQPDSEARPR
jgi:hypothetical protein